MPNPLQLSFCPRCDYSLQGLPESGACPECGTPYDQSFVVLRGRPVTGGPEPNGQRAYTAKRLCWSAGGAVVGGLLILRYRFFLLSMAGWWAVSTLKLFVEFVIFMNVIRPGEVLVWAGPAGIGQQPVLDPESKLPRLRWLTVLLFVVFAAGWAYRFRAQIDTSTAVIWVAVLAIIAVARGQPVRTLDASVEAGTPRRPDPCADRADARPVGGVRAAARLVDRRVGRPLASAARGRDRRNQYRRAAVIAGAARQIPRRTALPSLARKGVAEPRRRPGDVRPGWCHHRCKRRIPSSVHVLRPLVQPRSNLNPNGRGRFCRTAKSIQSSAIGSNALAMRNGPTSIGSSPASVMSVATSRFASASSPQ
jgi:hypothetical protein